MSVLLAAGWWGSANAAADFGFQRVTLQYSEEDGSPARQAGSHPFALTASILFNSITSSGGRIPDGQVGNLRVELPRGLIGTPALVAHCTDVEFIRNACPEAAAVGVISILSQFETETEPKDVIPALVQAPVYNLEPSAGSAAELGTLIEVGHSTFPMTIQLGLTAKEPDSLFASLSDDIPQTLSILGLQLILWGNPGDPAHNPYRGSCASSFAAEVETFEPLSKGTCPLEQSPRAPLISLPASCDGGSAKFEASTWSSLEHEMTSIELPPLMGCTDLPFSPAMTITPTSRNANSPSGVQLRLEQPNEGLLAVDRLASSQIAGAVVEFPAGMAINPPFATDRGVCTRLEIAAQAAPTAFGQGCPPSSRIGSVEVTTPLVPAPLSGEVFVAEPDDPGTTTKGAENSLDSRFALYLVLKAPERGIFVAQPVAIEPDPVSGRVRARLAGLPALPIERFELDIDSGPQAPLATPPSCGLHAFSYSLEPSSGNPPLDGHQSFSIDDNCAEGFKPRLSSAASSVTASSSASLDLQLSLSSYEPSPRSIALTLPEGFSAAVAGVPICPETSAANGACPPSTRIGQVRVAIGGGPAPLWLPSGPAAEAPISLAGPYRGAPYSLAIELPARAGPFDLGTVRLRVPVRVDPITAQLTIGIERVPQILAGVPLRYREIRLLLDRPGFLRTPTSCAPRQITGTAASAADGALADLAAGLRPHGCAGLPFQPSLALAASGGLGRNGHPAMRASLRSHPGEAGISAATFTLPVGELLDLGHIGAVCARRVPPARCPAGSRVGRARLRSPLAPAPLAGPIFLREPAHGLPDLLADMRGGGVHVLLRGSTAAASGGRLRFSFARLPDVPIAKAVIAFAGGRHGILVNSASLCARPRRVDVSLDAQSGRHRHLRPRLLARGAC